MTLPKSAIDKDHKLEQAHIEAGDALMEHRWHWTLDESNPNRVSMKAYAREVGVGYTTVNQDANGWAEWLAANTDREFAIAKKPGQAQTPGDFRELAKMGAEKKQAAQAIARETGAAITTVTVNKRDKIDAVVNRARTRAEEKGTTVEHEIDKAAEWQAKADKLAERERQERKEKRTLQFIKIEGKIGAMLARGREILVIAADVDFGDDERELIAESMGKLRSLLNLIDMRITGTTSVDWDAEFQKITK